MGKTHEKERSEPNDGLTGAILKAYRHPDRLDLPAKAARVYTDVGQKRIIKMNLIRFTCVAIAMCLVQMSVRAGDDTNNPTEQDLKQAAQILSTQDVTAVKATIDVTFEGVCFFKNLAKNGCLTATPTNIVKSFVAAPYPETFTVQYPLQIRVYIKLRNASDGEQQYTMEKASTNADWRMIEGVAIATNRQETQIPLPSDAAMKEANRILPTLLRSELESCRTEGPPRPLSQAKEYFYYRHGQPSDAPRPIDGL